MEDYWYLREGDFRPEHVDVLCERKQESREEVLRFLHQHGNLFASARDAEFASSTIRSYLIYRPWEVGIKEFHLVLNTKPHK